MKEEAIELFQTNFKNLYNVRIYYIMVNTKRKFRKRNKSKSKVKHRRKNSIHRNKKKYNKRNTHKHKSRRRKRKTLKGGTNIPYLPKGKPYQPGSSTNGLGTGFYYDLAKPDFHAPNGTAKPSNAINPHGKPMTGGNIVPRDILHLYRSGASSLKNVYNGFVGKPNNISNNPNPMVQPVLEKDYDLDATSPNFEKIVSQSNIKAANY